MAILNFGTPGGHVIIDTSVAIKAADLEKIKLTEEQVLALVPRNLAAELDALKAELKAKAVIS